MEFRFEAHLDHIFSASLKGQLLYLLAINRTASLAWQHGQGTHVWILRQVEESQCFLSNQYTGNFVQGHRHGRGTFYHASGAFYEGEWSKNKSVSKVNQLYIIGSDSQCT